MNYIRHSRDRLQLSDHIILWVCRRLLLDPTQGCRGSCSWRGHRLRKGRGTGRRGGFLRSCHDLAGGGCCTCLLGTWGLLCSTLLRSGSSGLCLGGSSGLCRGGSSGLRRGGSSGSGRGRKRSCWLRRFRLRRFALCSSSPDLCRLFYCYWWGWGRFFLFLLWLLLLVLFIILACLIIVLSLFVFTLLLVITLFLLFLLWNSSQLLVCDFLWSLECLR